MTSTFPDVTITSDRLVLRPYDEADQRELTDMMDDELTAAWTSVPAPYSMADAREWIVRFAPAERNEGRGIVFAVTEHLTQRLVGSVHLMKTSWRFRSAEIGYVVAPWARGEGYAVEAVLAVTDWLFHDQKFERLELRTAAGNTASQQVALKVGCLSEGVLRNASTVRTRTEDGGWAEIRTDVIVWGLLPEDLEDAPGD
ncbi:MULTISPECIES: GNAT family N-acetyltransferase [Streptomyces]|uniref:GNAT family N-acetyltransferase n=1 Tax=Streptomyces TaxID=1883 RepID=UPI000CD4A674|nr:MULTISPECIES: GNAT family N-acetyltransferase [Streptomyces]